MDDILLEKVILLTQSECGCLITQGEYLFFHNGESKIIKCSLLEKMLLSIVQNEPLILQNVNLIFNNIEIVQGFVYRTNDGIYLLINGQYDEHTHLLIDRINQTDLNINHLCYYQIINRLSDAIITVDNDGNICLFNPISLKIFDYLYQDFINQNICQLIDDNDPLGLIHLTDQVYQLNGKKRNGSKFPLEMTCVAQRNKLFTIIIRDLTDSKSYQEIKKLNLTKKNFIASMSHEIRTPLNGIIGMTQLIQQEQDLNSSLKEAVNVIHECGTQLVNLVNDILDYSKITSGHLKLVKEHFNLEESIQKCILCFSPQMKEKQLNITSQYDINLSKFIYGDQKRIRQVIFNLLSNALKFTNNGGILVETIKSNQTIAIKITDTGIGIPNDKIDSIFEAFNQITEAYTCQNTSGTGLGLAISRHLSRLMGGDLTVTSTIGVGSCFQFCFQVDEINNLDTNLDGFSEEFVTTIKNANILVVDDQANNRLILERMLSPYCRNLTIVGNSNDVLKLIKKKYYDVILIDIIMPGINGIELLELIRKSCDNSKIIAISSVSDTIDFSSKFDKILLKPINKIHLINVIYQSIKEQAHFEKILYDINSPIRVLSPSKSQKSDDFKISNNCKFNKINKSKRILVVEDNINNSLVIRLLLDRLGYQQVDIVNDGNKGVIQALSQSYDLILMDLKLPIMDGIQASTEILKVKPNSYIVIVSACILDEDKQKCSNCGINNYLAKPIDINQLKEILNNLEELYSS